MLRSTSTTQGVIALSSEESEFYALVKGTSGLGAVSMLKDLGVDISIITMIDKAVLEVRVDASAGRGIAVPRGAGRIRHIATPTLWVENLTQDVIIKITMVPGASNPTEHLDGRSIRRALERCQCYIREGRAGIALRAEVREITISHPEIYSVLVRMKLTRSRKRNWSWISIDHEDSDAVRLEQLRDQMM